MPAPCVTCADPRREEIDAALVLGQESLRALARRYGHDRSSLKRHADRHLSAALVTVAADRETAGATTALDRLEQLYADARQVLEAAKAGGQGNLSLAAIGRLTNLVELLAKLTGELDDRARVDVTVDLGSNPEFQRYAQVIASVVSRCSDCGPAVAAALRETRAELGAAS
jgi:hypothetical protein